MDGGRHRMWSVCVAVIDVDMRAGISAGTGGRTLADMKVLHQHAPIERWNARATTGRATRSEAKGASRKLFADRGRPNYSCLRDYDSMPTPINRPSEFLGTP